MSFAGADGPQEWLARGLPAGLLTTSRRGRTLWTASWNVSDTAGRRAWNVAYHGTDAAFEPQRPPVEHAAAGLDAALAHAEEFATRLRLGPWHTIFQQARRHPPPRSSPGSVFPDGSYSTASRRLVAMANAAWVFGGMGSWNDLPYLGADANAEYEQISHDLFSAIMSAYVAAANSDVSARA